MVEPITIATLITVIITSVTQIIQMILDYKRDKHDNRESIYELKEYNSNCCNINYESDKEEK